MSRFCAVDVQLLKDEKSCAQSRELADLNGRPWDEFRTWFDANCGTIEFDVTIYMRCVSLERCEVIETAKKIFEKGTSL